MTNEEMAVAIQHGNKDIISPLWEQMQQLLYMLAGRYYTLYEERSVCCGLTEDDFKQAAFLALLDMITAYNPGSDYKFTTYAKYSCMRQFNALLGLRTSKVINEPLNNCASFDEPIKTDAEDTRGDIIPDCDSEKPFDDAINNIWRQQLRTAEESAIDTLETERAHVIREIYFKGRTVSCIAEEMNVSESRVRYLKKDALYKLRCGKSALFLRPFIDTDCKLSDMHGTGVTAFGSGGSTTERAVEALEYWRSVNALKARKRAGIKARSTQ